MYKERFSADLIRAAHVENMIDDHTCVDVESFDTPLRDAANRADQAGRDGDAIVFRLFAALVSFHFRPEDSVEPFSNMIGFADGSRSLVGSDLDVTDIEALSEIVNELTIVALRTRVADLIWSQNKSRSDCARLAISGYAEMIARLLDGSASLRFEAEKATSVATQNFLSRAIVIAKRTGWQRAENDTLKTTAIAVLERANEEGAFPQVRFANLVLENRLEGCEHILDNLESKVAEALSCRDFRAAQEIQKLVITRILKSKTQSEDAEKSAYLTLSSLYEMEADASGSSFLKNHHIQNAVDSLHGVRGVRETRQRLHEKLKESQLHLSDDFVPISHSIDLSDEVQRLLDGYKDLDLLDAMRQLALTELPKDPDLLTENARKELERYPLASLFSTSILDERGRTRAKTDGGGSQNEDVVRHKIIQHQEINMGIAAQAAIRPARAFITEKFGIDQSLLFEICQLSPFVPRGLEHTISRGLQAFLYADDHLAAICLIPALESCLRSIVAIAGQMDTSLSTGGIEQSIGLSAMLGEHRSVLENVLGKKSIFAIENIFVHPLGPNIRNSVCHGLTPDNHFYSNTYVFANKLIFSFVLIPLVGENWPLVRERLRVSP